ncbi:MAG: outer membrane beta-barrel family protein, partial [Muribaculaceae bacterium]|nr:outer membrane beta-barrel family protein [Muribaculaceae bacterium]
SPRHGNNLFLRAGTTYHLTDKDDFYLNAFGMFGHRWGRSLTDFTSTVPGMWNTNIELSRNNSDNRGAHAEWGYTHKWSDSHQIDATVGYNFWGGPQWNAYSEEQHFDDSGRTEMEYREQSMPIHSNTWEAKVDYTQQLTDWLKLEAGFNGNYSHENTPNTTMSGSTPGDMTIAENLFNRFIYTNNISALYFTLGGKVKDFSFSAGLRSEAWQVRAQSLDYWTSRKDADTFKKNNFALFPSLYLSYSLPYDNEIQLNYTRRIRRPWGGQLNSFLNTSDPTNYSYGNEELEPQYSNAFELNYLKSFTWHLISVSAYVRTADNKINRISYLNPYDGIIYSTEVNVANQVNSGVEIVSKNSFFNKALDLTTTLNLYNNHIGAWSFTGNAYNPDPKQFTDTRTFTLARGSQNAFAWDIRMMANVKLPWGLSFQASGRYSSEHKEAMGTHQGGWNVDAGLRKIAGDWSFSLNARDIFDSRKFKSSTITDTYTQYNKRWRGGRTVSLTIKYSFGNMKPKKTARGMDGEPAEMNYSGEEG